MAKNGMYRGVWQKADPTFAEVLGMERKEKRTMAEKMEETSLAGRENILTLYRVKRDTADLPAMVSRLASRAQQAQTADDLDRLINDAMELEDRLYNAGRAVSHVRHRLSAKYVALLPRPEPESDEGGANS